MTNSQLKKIYQLNKMADKYGKFWENGVSVDLNLSKHYDQTILTIYISPKSPKWYEGTMAIAGIIGKKGGLKLSRFNTATKTEIQLFTQVN